MKKRPCAHYKIVHTRRGRKKILVNPTIRKRKMVRKRARFDMLKRSLNRPTKIFPSTKSNSFEIFTNPAGMKLKKPKKSYAFVADPTYLPTRKTPQLKLDIQSAQEWADSSDPVIKLAGEKRLKVISDNNPTTFPRMSKQISDDEFIKKLKRRAKEREDKE